MRGDAELAINVSCRSAELTVAHAGIAERSNCTRERRTGPPDRTRSLLSVPLFCVGFEASIQASWVAPRVITSARAS
jgi:hypothetical protein